MATVTTTLIQWCLGDLSKFKRENKRERGGRRNKIIISREWFLHKQTKINYKALIEVIRKFRKCLDITFLKSSHI